VRGRHGAHIAPPGIYGCPWLAYRALMRHLDARLDDRPSPDLHVEVRRSLQAEIESRDNTPLRIDDTLLDQPQQGDAAQPPTVSVAPNTIEVLTPA
jgi:hypothetical protein